MLAEQLVAENCLSQPAEICLFIKIAAIIHSHDFPLGRIASSQKTPNNSRSTAMYSMIILLALPEQSPASRQ